MNTEFYQHQLRVGVPKILKEVFGGNSYVLKGALADGTLIAIKEYSGDSLRKKRMLIREQTAIQFLRKNGIGNIPEILEIRPDLGLIVFNWIEGSQPFADHQAMDALITMCTNLHQIYDNGILFDNAIDAAYSDTDIIKQITNRISQLKVNHNSKTIKALCDQIVFRLNTCLTPQNLSSRFKRLTLSISDLGLHNVLMAKNSYNFIDFEFFGVDSVTKLVGDFLLHPRNEFNEIEIIRFIEHIIGITNLDISEVKDVLPLLVLKWSLIAYGRTLKEANMHRSNKKLDNLLKTSKGTTYLAYFDSLVFDKKINTIETFSQFERKLN